MEFFNTSNTMVHIALGSNGDNLSYIEAVATVAGFLCIWLASQEKIINYLFGLINVTLFAVIFFQIQLYASLLLQIFFFAANTYGWYAWSRVDAYHEASLKIRWMSFSKVVVTLFIAIILTLLLSFNIDKVFIFLAHVTWDIAHLLGFYLEPVQIEPDAFPFCDSTMMVLSIIAMILMTRKYAESWLLWIIINVISVVIFYLQGVLAMSFEYLMLLGISINGFRLWARSAKENGSIFLAG